MLLQSKSASGVASHPNTAQFTEGTEQGGPSPFLDPRDAAETTSLGRLAPLRPAPAESSAAGRGRDGRLAAERRGRRGDAEARMRLSIPSWGRQPSFAGSRGLSLFVALASGWR